MLIEEKINILADASKYDVSCSSSGSKRSNENGLGNASFAGICHSWADDGRCISLLKILLTNKCIYDCSYCQNRLSNDLPRAQFTPEEIADLTIEFYRRNYIEGLFLSSAIIKNVDYTMELLIKTLSIVRHKHKFNGYIHVKIIPGCSSHLTEQIGFLADRVSVNIELPSEISLNLLAPQKKKQAILSPMREITNRKLLNIEEKKKYRSTPTYVPAGQTTQLIIGATPDSDLQIMQLSQGLYDKFSMKRVYYSAYIPVGKHPALPGQEFAPPLLREHRLYQADWLLRFYNFRANELLDEYNPFLSTDFDPKCGWALRHPEFFPVDINQRSYEDILRIPGIGVLSAKRIIKARRNTKLTMEHIKKIGIVLKRAKYFITTYDHHKTANFLQNSPTYVGSLLLDKTEIYKQEQMTFFSNDILRPSLSLLEIN